VAADLERCADRARGRGGLVATAAFVEHAALLTPDPARRARRELAAARAKREAGALDAALGLLSAVEAGPPDPLRDAEVAHLRGQIAFDQRRGADAARLLLDAARTAPVWSRRRRPRGRRPRPAGRRGPRTSCWTRSPPGSPRATWPRRRS
jgi:hypothetical protein